MPTLTDPPTAHFDPAHVPVFPVITVEIVDGGTLLVDGQQLTIGGGEPATDAAVAAAAAAIRRRGLTHARVAAVLDDTTYTMIVSGDGQRFEIPAPPGKRPLWRRPWFIPAVVMLVALLAAAGTITATRQHRPPAAAAPMPANPPVPIPTELPVLPPDGWTTHATWFAQLRAGNQPVVVAAGGVVAAITPDNQLAGLDPSTGAPRWTAELGRAGITQGPIHTEVDGHEAFAVVTTQGLAWWPSSGGTKLRELELPPRATVSFDGTSPLVTLPDQHAATVVNGALADRIVPAGARAVRADGPVVTAVDDGGRLWRLVDDAPRVPDPVGTLAPPKKKAGRLEVLGTGGEVILVRWPDAGVIAAHSLTGDRLVGAPERGQYGAWASDRERIAVAHGYTVTLGRRPQLTPIKADNWRTTRVVYGRVYGSVGGAAARLGPKGAPLPQQHPEAVTPVAADTRHAYVIATAGGAPVLYALEPA